MLSKGCLTLPIVSFNFCSSCALIIRASESFFLKGQVFVQEESCPFYRYSLINYHFHCLFRLKLLKTGA